MEQVNLFNEIKGISLASHQGPALTTPTNEGESMSHLIFVVSTILCLFIFTGCATRDQIRENINENPISDSETKTIYIGDIESPEISDQETYERWIQSHGFTDAKIEKVFVPEQIEGNRFISSHYIFIIKRVPTLNYR